MPTTPTAFAEVTRFTVNPLVLRLRVLSLYRKFIRRAPQFVEMYELGFSSALVRTMLRKEFERNRYVSDPNVRNILLARGNMEFQETVNFWKQGCHVLRHFDNFEKSEIERQPSDFVRRFIKGEA